MDGEAMSVYVDDMKARVQMGRKGVWIMSHMIADTRRELDEMAERLELNPKWKQKVGDRLEHFDVTENYRQRAIQEGAIPLKVRELALKLMDRDLKEYLEG